MRLSEESKEKLYDICHLNPLVADAVLEYIENRRVPGDFLRAFLCNNLFATLTKHDGLTDIVRLMKWFYNEAPGNCWRSEENYLQWLSGGVKNS